MRRFSIFIFLLFVTHLLVAQNLTGVWRGNFYNEYELLFRGIKYRYEIQLKNVGQNVKGVTYSYQTTRFYGKSGAIGRWSPSTGDLTLKENKLLDSKTTEGDDVCLMTCYLTYRKEGNKEYLEGTYTSVNVKSDTLPCGGGIIKLEKVPDSDFELEDFLKEKQPVAKGGTKPGQSDFLITKPKPTPPATKPVIKPGTPKPPATVQKPTTPPKKTTTTTGTAKQNTPPKTPPPAVAKTKPQAPVTEKATPPPPVVSKPVAKPPVAQPVQPAPLAIKNRKNELFETIATSARFLEISFYDNGEIDGDTISVYDNNKLVVSKRGLSAEPVTIKLALDDEQPEHDLVMVAENLGTIPPNTALMIVQAGSQRFTVRLSSTEQKNAVVRFRYDPNALK